MPSDVTFLRLGPHFRVTLKTCCARLLRARALSRGLLPPRRNPLVESHHCRTLPVRLMLRPYTYHVPRRFTPSTSSLVSFQPDAPTGPRPAQNTPQHRSQPYPFGAASPLATNFGLFQKFSGLFIRGTSPRLAATRTSSSNKPGLGLSLSEVMVLRRFWRTDPLAKTASLQGFYPCVGKHPPPDRSTCGLLGLAGLLTHFLFPVVQSVKER